MQKVTILAPKWSRTFMEIGNEMQYHKIGTDSELIYEDGSIWSTLISIKIIGSITLWFPLPPSEVLENTCLWLCNQKGCHDNALAHLLWRVIYVTSFNKRSYPRNLVNHWIERVYLRSVHPAFHCFTCCDTSSSFIWRERVTSFQHFRSTKISNKFLNAWGKIISSETLLDVNMCVACMERLHL